MSFQPKTIPDLSNSEEGRHYLHLKFGVWNKVTYIFQKFKAIIKNVEKILRQQK